MRKIRIRLPAVLTDIGPGLNSVALALRLYTTVSLSERSDDQMAITLSGSEVGTYRTPLLHPVVRAISRFFQQIESTRLGLNIEIENDIPISSGLGAEVSFSVAGIIGANDLMGGPYDRDEVLELAATLTRPEGVIATVFGGAGMGWMDGDDLLYRSLDVAPLVMILALPQAKDYRQPPAPDTYPRHDVEQVFGRIPLLIRALMDGDIGLLSRLMHEPLRRPRLVTQIEHYATIEAALLQAGARVVAPVGGGPAILALADERHEAISEDVALALKSAGLAARLWVVPIDTQGVVITAVQST